uniref:Sec2p domain-containing protein n=1 Tax=Syphacia muris TaxID=451379 RepID=A0A0N5AHK1_9BILA
MSFYKVFLSIFCLQEKFFKLFYSESLSASNISLTAENLEESATRILELERELLFARNSIAEKDAKCKRLSDLQNHMDTEVHELTEKLFQEAYKMVNDAEERREKAEKLLAESRMKLDVLTAEVEALKIIVKAPSVHIARGGVANRIFGCNFLMLTLNILLLTKVIRITSKKNKRMENYVSAEKKSLSLPVSAKGSITHNEEDNVFEIDPLYYREFTEWHESGATVDEKSPFWERILTEEIKPCLNFEKREITSKVLSAIRNNTLELESVNEQKPCLKACALTGVCCICPYRLRIAGNEDWLFISLLARNRITAVCDFFTYIRYVNQGIVKSGLHDLYREVINLRKNMALARLGLGFVPKLAECRSSAH